MEPPPVDGTVGTVMADRLESSASTALSMPLSVEASAELRVVPVDPLVALAINDFTSEVNDVKSL